MVTSNLQFRCSSGTFYQKDVFEIIDLGITPDPETYYTFVISEFLNMLLKSLPGFSRYNQEGFSQVGRNSYFFNDDKYPEAVVYTVVEDYKDRFKRVHKKGEIFVELKTPGLYTNVKSLMDILNEIENNDWDEISEEKDFPKGSPDLKLTGDLIDFYYFRSEKDRDYFIFEFHGPEKRKKVVKKKNQRNV